ncbi:Flavonoid 3',5'-hydroxylase [Sesamum angolense]|uniref:Flavonoid 3',5'-hydroxylase n=1 Tax=Sesamum angolense TaxID=2727404 RepID=A0AAE1WW25_9LAMI|nr:Flavonoid 3',5'-hydroxylase [Sesamum angolense]
MAWIQRDPSIWDSPLEFKPERFLRDNQKCDFSGNSFHYLPFGSGRRICAGLPLAERMLMYLLASLLHSFEWKLDSEIIDMSYTFGAFLRKSTPLLAIPTPSDVKAAIKYGKDNLSLDTVINGTVGYDDSLDPKLVQFPFMGPGPRENVEIMYCGYDDILDPKLGQFPFMGLDPRGNVENMCSPMNKRETHPTGPSVHSIGRLNPILVT